MTARTPAPKASGVPPPLAFLSTLSLPFQPTVPLPAPQEFSEVISEALTAQAPSAEPPSHPAPANPGKTVEVNEKTPGPSNLLLALLARSFSSAQTLAETQKTEGAETPAVAPEMKEASSRPTSGSSNKAAPKHTTRGAITPPTGGTMAAEADFLSNAAAAGTACASGSEGNVAPSPLPVPIGKPAPLAAVQAKPTIQRAASWAEDDLSSAKATRTAAKVGFEGTAGPNLSPASADKAALSAAAKPESVTNAATTPTGTATAEAAPAVEDGPLSNAKATMFAVKAAGDAGAPVIGTPVANTSQRMNSSAERNDFAGPTEQKMPPGAVTAVAVTGVEAPAAVRPRTAKQRLQFDWNDTPSQVLTIMDPAGKAVENARRTEGDRDQTVNGQFNRIETFITHEAVNLRRKGAESLGVSLKVDERTELFLQLTNKDGQLQASLRCERGDFSALDSQWTQLQQSLARQNVHLMPLSGAGSNLPQSSDRQQRQSPSVPDEGQADNLIVEPRQTRNSKSPARSLQRWESWA